MTKIPIFQDSIILDQLNNKELDKKILEILNDELAHSKELHDAMERIGYEFNLKTT